MIKQVNKQVKYLCLSCSKHSINVWHYFRKIAIYSFFTCYQSICPTCLTAFVSLYQKVVVASPVYKEKWQQISGEESGVGTRKEHCRMTLKSKFCFSLNKMCSVGRSLYLSGSLCLYLWNECFRLFQEWYLWYFATAWGQALANQNRGHHEHGVAMLVWTGCSPFSSQTCMIPGTHFQIT